LTTHVLLQCYTCPCFKHTRVFWPFSDVLISSLHLFIEASVRAFINCDCRPYFRASALGIGYSFQPAITTPRINLIGFGTATAQSLFYKKCKWFCLTMTNYSQCTETLNTSHVRTSRVKIVDCTCVKRLRTTIHLMHNYSESFMTHAARSYPLIKVRCFHGTICNIDYNIFKCGHLP